MLRLKSRASCQCFTDNTTSCATNVTIAQPRNVPPRPNRQKAWKDTGRYAYCGTPEINGVPTETFFKFPASVMNNHFYSNGYGAPNSNNRKQDTLASEAKTAISQVNTSWQQGSAYALGYMYRSQSKLEANVGSMDRIARLKAQAVAKSVIERPS